MEPLRIEDISVADFAAEDIPGVLDYWYRSPPEYLAGMGIVAQELPSERLMREMLEINVAKNSAAPVSQQAILSIKVRGETIGMHELTHIDPPTGGIMHAHIWNPAYRGQGIGLVSYVRAMQVFFERFRLDHIFFETPAGNLGAQKVKAKLGIRPCGTGTITWPIVRRSLPTVSYSVARPELPAIERNMRAAWERRLAATG